jgi:peptidoglycan/xylan/chitin deacetylase (PgdA/CDA1 family)
VNIAGPLASLIFAITVFTVFGGLFAYGVYKARERTRKKPAGAGKALQFFVEYVVPQPADGQEAKAAPKAAPSALGVWAVTGVVLAGFVSASIYYYRSARKIVLQGGWGKTESAEFPGPPARPPLTRSAEPKPPDARGRAPSIVPRRKYDGNGDGVLSAEERNVLHAEVPLRVVVAVDDNGHTQGLRWLAERFDAHGVRGKVTWFLTGSYAEGRPSYLGGPVRAWWTALAQDGWIGLHGYSHDKGSEDWSADRWYQEDTTVMGEITAHVSPPSEWTWAGYTFGSRAPYLLVSDAYFAALERVDPKIVYDVSMVVHPAAPPPGGGATSRGRSPSTSPSPPTSSSPTPRRRSAASRSGVIAFSRCRSTLGRSVARTATGGRRRSTKIFSPRTPATETPRTRAPSTRSRRTSPRTTRVTARHFTSASTRRTTPATGAASGQRSNECSTRSTASRQRETSSSSSRSPSWSSGSWRKLTMAARERVSVLVLVVASCVGKNSSEVPESPGDYPSLGMTTVDPVVPGVLHLTFDDGPGPYTRDIVDTLNRRGLKATFFLVGRNIPGYRDVVDYERASGHQVGNHTYAHEVQPSLSEAVFKYRVGVVKENIGDRDNGQLFFRFPYGAAGPDQIGWLQNLSFDGKRYRVVGWNLDSQDFTYQPTDDDPTPHSRTVADLEDPCGGQAVPFTHDNVGYAQYIARKTGGGIMLFHDIQKLTHDGLDVILDGFENPQGYWSSLPAATADLYRRYYTCNNVPTDTPFRFTSLQGGLFPSYLPD